MENFILSSVLWILALYGLIEILKMIIQIIKYPKISLNGANLIITVHNQENNIEFFLRSFIYKMLYFNSDIPKITIVDLNSSDNTLDILTKFSKDFNFINILSLEEYINLLSLEH